MRAMLVNGAAVSPMKVFVHRLGLLGGINYAIPRSEPFVTLGECHPGGIEQALTQGTYSPGHKRFIQTSVERNE